MIKIIFGWIIQLLLRLLGTSGILVVGRHIRDESGKIAGNFAHRQGWQGISFSTEEAREVSVSILSFPLCHMCTVP
jgi:hypothetical protein